MASKMFSSHAGLAFLISAALLTPPAFAAGAHRSTSASHTTSHRASKTRHKSHRVRGQQAIEPDRVTQIQQALIQAHYLNGEANGKWDATTIAAMQKYQADHGWQTKLTPDSRALKSLGLGPDYSDAINAKGSSFSPAPATGKSAPPSQTAGFVAASGVNQ
jgi:peptidoglycan hydrolase-like protein with peptidoglycan-binding domain